MVSLYGIGTPDQGTDDTSAATVLGDPVSGHNMASGVSGALPASVSGLGLSASNGCIRFAVQAS